VGVENMRGRICVQGWDRAEVAVTVTKAAQESTDRLDDVSVAVEPGDKSLKFRTVYPPDLEKEIRVNYQLLVPRQVRLDGLRTLEGDITVRDVEGSVDVRTLHGNIEQINVAGAVVATALTGNIEVSLLALPDPPVPIVLNTVNGSVDLLLPPRANADLELSTVSGRIEGQYLFEVSAIPGDNARHARVGLGGVQISLRTIRGNLRVSERSERL
jgi:hypothetical protein